jgi:hypothetical protein
MATPVADDLFADIDFPEIDFSFEDIDLSLADIDAGWENLFGFLVISHLIF